MCVARLLAVLPHLRHLRIEGIVTGEGCLTLHVSATRQTAACPLCGIRSKRIHSCYVRTLRDLPCCGLALCLRVSVRRFRCDARRCPRRIFAEQFPDVAGARARLTAPLRAALRQIGMALGGQAGSRLAARLDMAASGRTLLRLVCAGTLPATERPRVLGIDEWSWRRGHRHGTILCDLERHCLVDLLPDRSAEAVAA